MTAKIVRHTADESPQIQPHTLHDYFSHFMHIIAVENCFEHDDHLPGELFKVTDDTYYGIPSMNSEYCFSPLKQILPPAKLQMSHNLYNT